MLDATFQGELLTLGVSDASPLEDIPWTEGQKAVIGHHEGPLQVIACAGSGKTTTVSRRIAEMVRAGIDRNTIVAFTFTENAADQLKVHIREEMQRVNPDNPILGEMFVGTIHSFCRKLLMDHLDTATRNSDILNANRLFAFLHQKAGEIGIRDIHPDASASRDEAIHHFKEDINTIRRELIVEELQRLDDPRVAGFLKAYDKFQEVMKTYHFSDFEELIYRAVTILSSNPDQLSIVRSKYKYIIVDEYQDVDTAQESLIELLAGERKNVCVVGDDDQSIYRWRGARVQNFLAFKDKYGAVPEKLEQNLRSTQGIATAADRLITRNRRRLGKKMFSTIRGDVGDVYALQFPNEDDENTFICNKIQELNRSVYIDGKGRERTIGYRDMAVLLRRKRDMESLVVELERRNIPFTVKGLESVFSRPELRLVRAAFKYIADGVREKSGMGAAPLVNENLLRTLIRMSPIVAPNEEGIIDYLRDRREWFRDPTAKRFYPQDVLQDLLVSMGVGAMDFQDPSVQPLMYDLGQVSTLLSDFESVYRLIFPDKIVALDEFLDWAEEFAESELEDPTFIDAVRIMTIHGAKGTEFAVVFIPSLTGTKWRGTTRAWRRKSVPESIPEEVFSHDEYEEDDEDRRRLFYVAMTRSKKYLFMSGAVRYRGYATSHHPNTFWNEIRGANDPSIMVDNLPDPTPREKRDISGMVEYVYPTSYSDLRYYIACPYDYMIRKMFKIQPRIDSSFGYGLGMHNVLRLIHESTRDGLLPTASQVQSMVDDASTFYLRYAEGSVEEGMRKKAKSQLSEYVRAFGPRIALTFRPEVPFEFPLHDPVTGGIALVSGAIDLLEKHDPSTGKVTQVDIVDFKTEKEPSTEYDPRVRDAVFQVRLYGCATKTVYDLQAVNGYIHYLDEGERKAVNLSEGLLAQVENTVVGNVRGIMSRRFYPKPDKAYCGDCDHRKICTHHA